MTEKNPATPPQGATPGSDAQGQNSPSGSSAPATPANGNNNEGMVTIPTSEYNRLVRQDARARSPKGSGRVYTRPAPQGTKIDPSDPNYDAVVAAQVERDEANRRAMQAEVRGKVRDLLADERFKGIPKSTRDLILQSPHMLTEAETLEDAMYDIEDKLIELAGSESPSNPNPVTATPSTTPAPAPRETPPVVTPGSPAPVDAGALEDTSNLRGPARSTAILRNAFKKQSVGGDR